MPPILELPDDASGQSFPPTRHILVVDDEKTIVWMLRESLELIPNCKILTASNGLEALQVCQGQSFDLLLTDYKMPEMDGLTLAGYVRYLSPQTTIIMLTAHGGEELGRQATAIGINCILSKPIRLAELRRIIEMALNDRPDSSG